MFWQTPPIEPQPAPTGDATPTVPAEPLEQARQLVESWLPGGLTQYLIALIVILAAALLLRRWLSGRRESAYFRQHAREVKQRQAQVEQERQSAGRLASRIIATSSTSEIAGFEIKRQVEALFTDGHASAADAVAVVKALAVKKGANALINLRSERHASGKYVANADAVIVQPREAEADS
ncbi:MAG: hypothetical protein KDE45_19335 [Caldilineaceae bacterium]|nr:hypothetical protein [Caldilineaceae bacterium]